MTRAELQEAGAKRTNYGRCKGCTEPIEWWLTAAERPAPYNLMPNPESEAVSHFATCPKAEQFKKEPHRCTPIYPSTTTQESLLFSEPSSSSDSSPSSSAAPSPQPSRKQPKNEGNS
jgi:hypothetical protein